MARKFSALPSVRYTSVKQNFLLLRLEAWAVHLRRCFCGWADNVVDDQEAAKPHCGHRCHRSNNERYHRLLPDYEFRHLIRRHSMAAEAGQLAGESLVPVHLQRRLSTHRYGNSFTPNQGCPPTAAAMYGRARSSSLRIASTGQHRQSSASGSITERLQLQRASDRGRAAAAPAAAVAAGVETARSRKRMPPPSRLPPPAAHQIARSGPIESSSSICSSQSHTSCSDAHHQAAAQPHARNRTANSNSCRRLEVGLARFESDSLSS